MVSKKRAEKKRKVEESRIKAAGVKEYRAALEACARDRVVVERWGAGVSLAVMEALAKAASLETRTEAEARGGNKRKSYAKRRVETTWLLADDVRGPAYTEAVGITDEAHRALPRDAAAQSEAGLTAEGVAAYDSKKMVYYTTLVLQKIAAQCSEPGDDGEAATPVTGQQLRNASAKLLAARAADANCACEKTFPVNFSRVGEELRVAEGARSELARDRGQVVRDILARAGIPADLFVPIKRARGRRAQRRGARTLVMADGRKERAPAAVTRAAAAAELAKKEESGELDVGREFPPRLLVEVTNADGSNTTKPLGACGRVLDLRARITRRLTQLMDEWRTLWRPAFESMGEEEVARQLARHRLDARAERESLGDARTRLATAWLWAMSDRSKPAQAGGKCSAGCDACETHACCSVADCGKSRAVWACACGQPDVMRCGRCARMGRGSASDVQAALNALGAVLAGPLPTSPATQQQRLEQLVRLERIHAVSELLAQLGEPAWLDAEGCAPHLPTDGTDAAREARLLSAQMGVGVRIALWADGSPMLNKPWQLCTWHLMHDALLFVHGQDVERECRRPEVFFIMQDADGLEALKYQNGVRLEELHALNEPLVLPGDLRPRATVRFLEGDNPELQRACGVCSGGGAQQSCCRCKAVRKEHTDLVKSARAEHRSLGEAVALAERAAGASDAYKLRFGPDYGTAADLAKLAYEIGVEGGVGVTRKQNEAKVRVRCQGYASAPALLGSNLNALEEVLAIDKIEAMPDYALHALKGLLALLFETIESTLSPADRASLEKNFDRLHKGGATVKSGVHRRLELASTPALLGAFELGELREAMDALAQAMVWGIRVTHARWHAQYHFCVVRTAVLMHKFGVLLARCVPALKMTAKGEKHRTLYGLFFHQLTAHLVGDLKRVCTMHVMCEWMEMWWGPLRRLTLATSSKDTAHATLNMIRRMWGRQEFGKDHGARASYAEPSHSDHGPIGDAYLKNYGALDRERLELDERFLGADLEALLRQIPEYVELGEGVWYSRATRSGKEVLVFHVGADDPDHALPARQHFRSQSARDGRALEEAAFERMRRAPGSLVAAFCSGGVAAAPRPTSVWAELLRRAERTVEPDTDDEDDEDDDDDDALHAEARELVGDGDDDVEVAPAGPSAPLSILDADTVSGVWSDAAGAPLATSTSGLGVAYLCARGERIGTFSGTLAHGKPEGHGRLEMGSGDGWCGEMKEGEVAGRGEAWDEAGNRFTGQTPAPPWLLASAARVAAAAARAARAARAPFDAPYGEEYKASKALHALNVPGLRRACVAEGVGDKGTKPILVARLLDVKRMAHEAAQSVSASAEVGAPPEGGHAGTIAWAGGGEEQGLWEEGTLKLLHREDMTIAMKGSIASAIARAEGAAAAAATQAAAAATAVAAAPAVALRWRRPRSKHSCCSPYSSRASLAMTCSTGGKGKRAKGSSKAACWCSCSRWQQTAGCWGLQKGSRWRWAARRTSTSCWWRRARAACASRRGSSSPSSTAAPSKRARRSHA